MFFYQETKYFHYDSHWGNFLYHKIKPGGYFHYNIFGNDYYIENYGFFMGNLGLWRSNSI